MTRDVHLFFCNLRGRDSPTILSGKTDLGVSPTLDDPVVVVSETPHLPTTSLCKRHSHRLLWFL